MTLCHSVALCHSPLSLSFQDSCVARLSTVNSWLIVAGGFYLGVAAEEADNFHVIHIGFLFSARFRLRAPESEWGPLPRQAIPFFGGSVLRFFLRLEKGDRR
jgi:hypothetical protein